MISIIMPVYNEEKYISKSLDSILNNKIDFKNIEIIIVDGNSNDNTKEILKKYIKKFKFIKLFDNPGRIQAKGLNIGLLKSRGELIIRCDAHSVYPENYISELIRYHKKNIADNIGGSCETIPANDSIKAKAIAGSMNNIFGVGYSFRSIKNHEDIFVDTIPFGSFKKELINKIWLYDEQFIVGEDLDYNLRIRKNNGKLLMLSNLVVRYIAKENFSKLINMSFNYGYWKTKVNKKNKKLSSLRQLVPPGFILTIISLIIGSFFSKYILFLLIGLLFLYFSTSSIFSLFDMVKNKKSVAYLFLLILSFTINHFFYGTGYLLGLLNIKKK